MFKISKNKTHNKKIIIIEKTLTQKHIYICNAPLAPLVTPYYFIGFINAWYKIKLETFNFCVTSFFVILPIVFRGAMQFFS